MSPKIKVPNKAIPNSIRKEESLQRALKLWIVMARAHNALAMHEQKNLSQYKMSRGEYSVLDVLFFKGPVLLSVIQDKILASSGGITFLVDRLEKKGLVERRRSQEDRRAIYAVLTPKGEEFAKNMFPKHAEGLSYAISSLDEEELEELIRLLRKLGRGAVSLFDQPRQK